MDRDEQVLAAHDRIQYNRQRAQLKNHLQLSARYSGSDFMSREQLSTAAKLAGMEHVLTDERLDGFFSPRLSPRGSIKNGKTDWRYVNKELAYPEIPRPSAPATTAYRQQREKAEASRRAKAEAVQRALKSQEEQEPEPVKPQTPKKDPFEGIGLGEVKKFHKIIADHFRTRFAEIRTGFRLLDQDQSGTLSKKEMRALVHLFNLNVPDRLVDAFLALADYKNNDAITHEQFARIMGCDDIVALRDEMLGLKASPRFSVKTGYDVGQPVEVPTRRRLVNRKDPLKGLDRKDVIKAHNALYAHFTNRFSDVRKGFRVFDTDNSGTVSRAEMRRVIKLFNLDIKPEIVDAFISLADRDQTDSIPYADFARIMLSEDIYALQQSQESEIQALKFNSNGNKQHSNSQKLATDERKAQWMSMAHFISPEDAPTNGTAGLDFGARRGPPTLRHGVKPFDIRDTQRQLKQALLRQHESLEEAFILAEASQPGVLNRSELMKLMQKFLPRTRTAVLENLCDLVDEDQDGTILMSEWLKCLKAVDILSAHRKPPKVF